MPTRNVASTAASAAPNPPVIQHYATTNSGCAAYLIVTRQVQYVGPRMATRMENVVEFVFSDPDCIAGDLARALFMHAADSVEPRSLLAALGIVKADAAKLRQQAGVPNGLRR